jgi:hypothetical protein
MFQRRDAPNADFRGADRNGRGKSRGQSTPRRRPNLSTSDVFQLQSNGQSFVISQFVAKNSQQYQG